MIEKLSEIILDQTTIRKRVRELGKQISSDMQGYHSLVVVPVLDGGMIFAADLIREIELPLTLLPIKASSYGNAMKSSGNVEFPWDIPTTVRDKDLLLVDDILDTGHTLNTLISKLLQAGAHSVRTCVLLRKKHARHLSADYLGFEIPNKFVVGYGLDLAGRYRNLPDIGVPMEC